jgi:hypothetical protein
VLTFADVLDESIRLFRGHWTSFAVLSAGARNRREGADIVERLSQLEAQPVLAHLASYGVLTVDTDADKLNPRLIGTYLELKHRGRV